ncbi:MAG: DUF89 family protein [Chlorobi bacterium]|nr:DUF89 family protein [Chlorobiota bacterium]
MKLQNECLPCALNSLVENLNKTKIDNNKKKHIISDFLKYLADVDYSISPPELGRYLHNLIKHKVENTDPFKEEKIFYNHHLYEKYDYFKNIILTSINPFFMAVKMSIVGNIIDFGTNNKFDLNTIGNLIESSEITIDKSEQLKEEIGKANLILYLGDNAGEIVFDKLLIEYIKNHYSNKEIYFAVREKPIINDITKEDADFVGMSDFAEVISNGYDIPGTSIEKSSPQFLRIYNSADLIISKGQGNFETLDEESKNIFFLLMAKCDLVANYFNVQKGSLIVAKKR